MVLYTTCREKSGIINQGKERAGYGETEIRELTVENSHELPSKRYVGPKKRNKRPYREATKNHFDRSGIPIHDLRVRLPLLYRQSYDRAEQSRAEQSRAEQSRAEQSRAEQSRAEQSR